jgi:MoxR-like ATPase
VMGASPRASIALLRASRALAAADGRAVVYPEDIKALLRPVLAHRLMLTSDATLRGETVDTILERVVSKVKPPLGVKETASNGNGSGTAKPRRRAKVTASA